MKIIRRILVGPLVAVLLLPAALGATPALANGVVGNGLPAQCTEGAFDTAFAAGGLISFDCGAAPWTITFTGQKLILTGDVTIDGGGLSLGGLTTIDHSQIYSNTANGAGAAACT